MTNFLLVIKQRLGTFPEMSMTVSTSLKTCNRHNGRGETSITVTSVEFLPIKLTIHHCFCQRTFEKFNMIFDIVGPCYSGRP